MKMTDAFSNSPNKKKVKSDHQSSAPTTPLQPIRATKGLDTPQSTLSTMISPTIRKPNLEFKRNTRETYFNDPIHGTIKMGGLCLRIIDTKEFQRLRHLKQLGACNYVYPGATHSRFEHSIGVAHLAEEVVKNLRVDQPDITDADLLCVKVAGLCHDLGHGPFSHVFDGVFMKRMISKATAKTPKSEKSSSSSNHVHNEWKHEEGSVAMFNFLLTNNHIDLSQYNLTAQDKLFIEEIIRGDDERDRKGRPAHKFYLYDIVNNTRSGLDVDKLDYFQRDMKYTNASTTACKFERFIEFGRVRYAEKTAKSIDNPRMICYPEKLAREAVDVFALRFRLHQSIYTHKSVKLVEFMITDALEIADEFIKIPGSITSTHPDGLYKLSECAYDAHALSNLDDRILYIIENSTEEGLKPAQAILKRLNSRYLYKCVGKQPFPAATMKQLDEKYVSLQLIDIANKKIQALIDNNNNNKEDDDDETIETVPDDGNDITINNQEDDDEDAKNTSISDLTVNNLQHHNKNSSNNNNNSNNDDNIKNHQPFHHNSRNNNNNDNNDSGDETEGNNNHNDYINLNNNSHLFSLSPSPSKKRGIKRIHTERSDYCTVFSQDSIVSQYHPMNLELLEQHDFNDNNAYHEYATSQQDSNNHISNNNKNNNNYVSGIAMNTSSFAPTHHNISHSNNDLTHMFLNENDIIVEKMNIHYGQKDENPVKNLRFFPKDAQYDINHVATHMTLSAYETLLPKYFQELAIRVFCRNPKKAMIAKEAFDEWKEGNFKQK